MRQFTVRGRPGRVTAVGKIARATLAVLLVVAFGSRGISGQPAQAAPAPTLPPLPAGWSTHLELGMTSSSGDAAAMRSTATFGLRSQYLAGGVNTNNPGYRQFFRMSEVPDPSRIFAFVEEHPDSINDGYFVNRFDYYEWFHLPASYHNGGANFAFADGHSEFRSWRRASTMPPARPDAAGLPFDLLDSELDDFNWVLSRTSVLNEGSRPKYRPSRH